MGVCSSSASEDGARKAKKGKRGHRARQRSDSSSIPADPATVKVAHITPRTSLDEEPPCVPATDQLPAPCGVECHCEYEAEQKESSDNGAILSAIIVIESPPPNNRHLLLTASDVEGRPSSSSHSTDIPSSAPHGTSIAAEHTTESHTSPEFTGTAALPHSIASMPASQLTTTTHTRANSLMHHTVPKTLSASSSPKASFSSPSHSSFSHSAAPTPCPLHTRTHSLSILQVLREVNHSNTHSRNPSFIYNHEHTVKEEQPKVMEEQKEQPHDNEQASAVVDDTSKGVVMVVEEKEMSVDETEYVPTIHRARIDTVDKMICSI